MMDYKKVSMILMFALSLAFATTGAAEGNIQAALCELYDILNSLVPIAALVLILGAGVVYAAGQMLGAETRARASVWATSMLIGAIIGILIIVLVPPILSMLLGQDISSSCV